MKALRSVAPLVALLLLAVFLMPATLAVLAPVDGSATLPENMDSTPDIALVAVPIVFLPWQPPPMMVAPAPEPAARLPQSIPRDPRTINHLSGLPTNRQSEHSDSFRVADDPGVGPLSKSYIVERE